MVKLEIDGKPVEVRDGATVMEAATRLGVHVPHFCYHRKLSIAANCRMCLVEVEKAPKPLPACATPVTEGMKVWTHSERAVQAQRDVMEFLLINHPLDCPICDQGGECQLQDLAVGYGASNSRFEESKRAVPNKNLGPLISTDMTRCIHCTRCVRFGQEIAGIMELGMAGRGEHSEIMPFVARTVDSELSGNLIDICPVGALTSKPFRYRARTWELARRRSVSPHCGLGSNLIVQIKGNRVMRVVPFENEALNECWLSDKDRFSYEGLNSERRLARPMIRGEGGWRDATWSEALGYTARRLREIAGAHGADSIGALATPHQTLEELYLLQKLVRGLGSEHVDFRLRQVDFRADRLRGGVPWLGLPVAELAQCSAVLIVGSTLRKDHPLIAQRLRQAAKRKLAIHLIHPVDDDLLMPVANRAIVAPSAMPATLARLVEAVAARRAGAPAGASGDVLDRIADSLVAGERVAILLGNLAEHHPQAAALHSLAQRLAALLECPFGFLGEAANSVGGYAAGAIPGPGGLDARAMLEAPRKGWLLLGVEPELDCANGAQALAAMHAAEFVVAMSPYQHRALEYAQVLLPIAPFTETAGSFVNTEGRVQSFNGVVQPLGETRPGWKVLRVLANLLELPGFDHDSTDAVRAAIRIEDGYVAGRTNALSAVVEAAPPETAVAGALERIGEVRIHDADAIVRRAPALHATADGAPPLASLCGALAGRLGLAPGDLIELRQGGAGCVLYWQRDDRLPDGCVRVPVGHELTAMLGDALGPIEATRVAAARRQVGG